VPHPNLWEVKNVYQPVRFVTEDLSQGRIRIENRHDFLNLSELEFRWAVRADDAIVVEAESLQVDVDPHATRERTLELPEIVPSPGVEYFLEVSIWDDVHHEVAWEQFELPIAAPKSAVDIRRVSKMTPRVTEEELRIEGDRFVITFDRARGTLASIAYEGVEVLRLGPEPNFWRAPTDNDYGNEMPARLGAWRSAGSDRIVQDVSFRQNSARDVIVDVVAQIEPGGSRLETSYHVYGSGDIVVDHHFIPGRPGLPDLPRFGMTLTLPAAFDHM